MTDQFNRRTSQIASLETGISEKTTSLKAAQDVRLIGRPQRTSFRATLEGYDESPPIAKPRSSAAERMRAHRQRRRDGLRCVTIELRETEIDALIRKELLKPEARNDLSAIIDALYAFLDRTLDATL